MYRHNTSFFNQQVPTVAYWAGFIAADGCIYAKDSTIRIIISEKDKSLLHEFIRDIQYDGKIHQRIISQNGKLFSRVKVSIPAKKNIEYLRTYYNITPRKSLTLQPPNIDDLEMIKAFIAGYIDGDGCIISTDKTIRLSIVGNKDIIDWISLLFSQWISDGKSVYVRAKGRIFELVLYGKRARFIINLLRYYGRLDRKWRKHIATES
jgi:intein/homing endonuclease